MSYLSHLPDVLAGCWFIKSLMWTFLKRLVHFSSGGELEDQVDPATVPEVSIHP